MEEEGHSQGVTLSWKAQERSLQKETRPLGPMIIHLVAGTVWEQLALVQAAQNSRGAHTRMHHCYGRGPKDQTWPIACELPADPEREHPGSSDSSFQYLR